MGLFSTTGIRGIVNERFTPEFAAGLGACFGSMMKKAGHKKVYVCVDNRTSADMTQFALCSGIVSTGVDAVQCGVSPSPAMLRLCRMDNAPGIIVTSSHNPPQYSGTKFVLPDGVEISGEKQQEFEDLFESKNFSRASWDKLGEIRRDDSINKIYMDMLLEAAGKKEGYKGLHVVVDCGHGTQSLVAPEMLRMMGCKVTTIDSNLDGFFHGRFSEPTPKSLEKLSIMIKALGADLGVGFDGDGDRSIFVDHTGEVHSGNVSACIVAKQMFEKEGLKKIVTSVSSSKMIDDISTQYGGEVVRTKVGAADIVEELVRKGGGFGYEENGGAIFPGLNYAREGALHLVYVLKAMIEMGVSFKDLADSLPPYTQVKGQVECPDEKKEEVLSKLEQQFKGDTIDGVKIEDGDGWVLLRPSNTEPLMRIYAESTTKEKALELVEKFRGIVESNL